MTIYTIGHSNISFDEFVERLLNNGIDTLVDVRSAPYSKYVSHFNHDILEAKLAERGISYEFMGDRLGGRPRNPSYFKPDGNPDYHLMAEDEYFIEGLGMLMRMSERSEVCIMCSEDEPAKCHRGKLVSAQLAARGVNVLHILADGALESEEDNAAKRVTAKDKQMELF